MSEERHLGCRVEYHERTVRPSAGKEPHQPAIRKHALDEVLAKRGVGEAPFFLDRKEREPVEQHLGEGRVRAVSMLPTDGMVRGMKVIDLGGQANKAVVFPIIDHGPLPNEALEYTVYLTDNPSSHSLADFCAGTPPTG